MGSFSSHELKEPKKPSYVSDQKKKSISKNKINFVQWISSFNITGEGENKVNLTLNLHISFVATIRNIHIKWNLNCRRKKCLSIILA